MGVNAVASVVLQKLHYWLSEEPLMENYLLEEIKVALKEINAETRDCLLAIYSVEDLTESSALRITRQRKTYRFLMRHARFRKRFSACNMLRRRSKIELLNLKAVKGKHPPIQPDNIESTQNSFSSPRRYPISPTDRIDSGEGNPPLGNPKMLRRSGSSVTDVSTIAVRKFRCRPTVQIEEGGDDPSLRRVSLYRMLWRSDASLMRERFRQTMLTHSYSYHEEELSIIGYKRRFADLWNRLETADDRIISIVGEPGSGKTMLARAIYGNRDFRNRFNHVCAWVTIFQESQPKDILLSLLNQLKKSNGVDNSRTREDDLKWINAYLLKKDHLIVLDGVQSMDQWESLKGAFPDARKESKIIVTTCVSSLAISIDSKVGPHVMGRLLPLESWVLFLRSVGLKEDDEVKVYPDSRIIEVCNGLPLNIVLLGSLLSTKDREMWDETLDTNKDWKTSDIVMLSYNDLDPHMKLCLLYMMMFPKDLDIPVRRLQRLWLAEGFVKPAEGKFEEDVAQEYFQNLVKRSLIMVTKLCSDGSHRKCRLLDALHDHLLPNAHYLSLFHVHGGSGRNERGPAVRRLIEFADGNSCSLNPSEYQCLRSYISFNFQKKDTPALYVGNLVGNMIGKGYGLLRVLDLEGVYKPSLPENFGDLFHLRYLGLRWTFLDRIPKSVGELPYLETLDLKHTFINKIPQSIWKLKHLRHLNLNEIHLDKDSRLDRRDSLPKLLTLWGLSVDQDCPIENGLNKFKDLRELGISLHFSKSSSSSETHDQVTKRLVDWVSSLADLRQLRLRSKDGFGNPADLRLTSTSFSALGKLSHMKLLGKLQELPVIKHFPPHIKVLTLSVSRLREDPMPVLGQLPELTVLRLLANSYMGEKMICPAGSFKNLLDLKLWMLCNLKEWEVKKTAMEKLKELNVRCCRKLEKIPTELLQQKAFQELVLNDMPGGFRDKITDGKQGKFSITVKDYGFRMEDYLSDGDLNGCV